MNHAEIISKLIDDLQELLKTRKEFEQNDLDGYYDYLSGTIDRTASVLRMLGVDDKYIPNTEEEE
jgi:hypothetical protein